MRNLGHFSGRERYRFLVSVLIIPLGAIIMIRAVMIGTQAWTLIMLGLAFVGLGIVRLRTYTQSSRFSARKKK